MYNNGGHQDYNYTTTMKMLIFEVLCNKNSLVNILSLSAVVRIFKISIYADIDSVINVHLDYGTNIKLKHCSGGVYYYYITTIENNSTKNQATKSHFSEHTRKLKFILPYI